MSELFPSKSHSVLGPSSAIQKRNLADRIQVPLKTSQTDRELV